MSHDPTESIRRVLVPLVNSQGEEAIAETDSPEAAEARLRAELIEQYGEGDVFDTGSLQEHFEVTAFAAPFVIVCRKADGQKGSLTFTHRPRFYFDFRAV